MDFQLTKELQMLQKMYQSFAETEIKPLAAEIDEEERFPKETIPKLARYGFLGIPYEKKYGGQDKFPRRTVITHFEIFR